MDAQLCREWVQPRVLWVQRGVWLVAIGVHKTPGSCAVCGNTREHTSAHPAQAVPSLEPMVPRGLEPRTLRLLAVRSDQLSSETLWKGRKDVPNQ